MRRVYLGIMMLGMLLAPLALASTNLEFTEDYPLGYAGEEIVFAVYTSTQYFPGPAGPCPPGGSGRVHAYLKIGSWPDGATIELPPRNETYILSGGVLADSDGNIVASGLPTGHEPVVGQGGRAYICSSGRIIGESRVWFQRLNINITVKPLFNDYTIELEPGKSATISFEVANHGSLSGYVVAHIRYEPMSGLTVTATKPYLKPGETERLDITFRLARNPPHEKYTVNITLVFNIDQYQVMAAGVDSVPIYAAIASIGGGENSLLWFGVGFVAVLLLVAIRGKGARSGRTGSGVALLLLLLGLATVGFSLAGENQAGGGYTTTTTTGSPGPTCNYGKSKTVKIVDSSFGTDAYLEILYHPNGTLADFQVRYDYGRPRPTSGGAGSLEIWIDGSLEYQGPPLTKWDIPPRYEDGQNHEITVVYKC